MGWPLDGAILGLLTGCVVVVMLHTGTRRLLGSAGRSLLPRLRLLARRLGVLPPPAPCPDGRPIEVVAREARRLGRLYRSTRTGTSFARSDGVRRAYDGVLAESCDALGLSHLLGLLDDGDELDAERERVVRLLHVWGIDLECA